MYCGNKEVIATDALKLQIAHQLDSFSAVGTTLGAAEYILNAQGQCAAALETLVETLMQLNISLQSPFLLLHASLQARMTHLMRAVPREALHDAHASHGCYSVARCGSCAGRIPRDGGIRHKHGGAGQGVYHVKWADDVYALGRSA